MVGEMNGETAGDCRNAAGTALYIWAMAEAEFWHRFHADATVTNGAPRVIGATTGPQIFL